MRFSSFILSSQYDDFTQLVPEQKFEIALASFGRNPGQLGTNFRTDKLTTCGQLGSFIRRAR